MLTKNDVVIPELTSDQTIECVKTALVISSSIKDRQDLHERGFTERFNNVAMGEMSEQAVVQYLRNHGKTVIAPSYEEKTNGKPDAGYDITVIDKKGKFRRCSIKSSISAYKAGPEAIIGSDAFHLASKKSEIRDINIQVYFWLDISGKFSSRTTVPSEKNMMIVGWACRKDVTGTSHYAGENREVVEVSLKDLRPMEQLLQYLS